MVLGWFDDILVTPYTALLGMPGGGGAIQGGPHWPNFATQREARYCRRGRPRDKAPLPPEGSVSPLRGRFAWGGGCVPHFGHQLLDHSMRLGPTMMVEPDAVFLFVGHVDGNIRSWADTPPFFKQIAAWHGLDSRRVRILSEPTRVETLLVAPQAEQPARAVPPADEYLDYLDVLVARRLPRVPRSGVMYVSRSRMPYHYAGEVYLDRVFEAAGVTVMHPERWPLEEQLRQYRSAESLVLAEGSALHALQLLGRNLSHLKIVQRRFETIAQWITPALQARFASVEFVNVLRGVLEPAGTPGSIQTWRGMGILDEEALLASVPGLLGDRRLGDAVRRRWNSDEFRMHVEAEVLHWASEICQGRSVVFHESTATISEQLREAGLAHLARPVERCIARGFLASVPDRLARAARGERGTSDPVGECRVAGTVIAVAEGVPDGAQVLVISNGDPRLLVLQGVNARHFPATEDGAWIGHDPADSGEAIARLEAAVARGARYLLIPTDSLWWLEHYEVFAQYLQRQTRQIRFIRDTCALFALDGRRA